MMKNHKSLLRQKRRKRTKAKIASRSVKFPRLAVFRSLKSISAQIINDKKGETLVAATSQEIKNENKKLTRTELAAKVGELISKKAREKKIIKVVFDRRHYKYHGQIKALAEKAKEKGLKF